MKRFFFTNIQKFKREFLISSIASSFFLSTHYSQAEFYLQVENLSQNKYEIF